MEGCFHHSQLYQLRETLKADYAKMERTLKNEARMKLVAAALAGAATLPNYTAHDYAKRAVEIADETIPQDHGDDVKTYRHKHGVEAMRWTGTPEDRARFTEWFGATTSCSRHAMPKSPYPRLTATRTAAVGAWILHADGEFLAMEDAVFTATYEEVAKTLETAKTFGPGLAGRAALGEYLKGVDPAKALLVWIRTAVDTFLRERTQ